MTQSLKRRGSPGLTIINNQNYSAGGIFPIIFSGKISGRNRTVTVGDLYLDIERNKTFNGTLFIQAQATDHPTKYSDLKIFADAVLYPSTENILSRELIFTREMAIQDFLKIDITIPAQIVGQNEKIGLIISARNIGPGDGSFNTINLIYFQKKD